MKGIDIGLLLLRLVFGAAMLFGHGWSKMMKLFTESPIEFADPIGLGPAFSLGLTVFAEVLCSLLIMLGLFTRWALIPLIITMLVAFLVVHISDPFPRMEKAILYLTVYITLILTGPGKYALDDLWRKGQF